MSDQERKRASLHPLRMHGGRWNRAINMSHHSPPVRRTLLRLGAAALIPDILEEQRISADALFGRAEINRRSLGEPEPVVPLAWLGRVFESAVAASAQAEFGLLVGLRAGSRFLDLGQDPTPSDTQVSAALMRVISQPASFPNAFLTLSISGDTCIIGCIELPRNVIARDQLTDCAMGFAAGALRVLCGPSWRARNFQFAHKAPPDPSRHIALLQASVSFDANVTAMEFGSAWLERDHAYARRHDYDYVHEQRPHQDLIGEIRAVLASWNGVDRPSATAVASLLGLQPRTLNRLLGKTGTSLKRILEEVRYETAQRMLRDSAAPIVSIAWSLGYEDASVFSRAFRRWSGMTPSEWRKAADKGGMLTVRCRR
jgi:AraC-like DNA-binding protein